MIADHFDLVNRCRSEECGTCLFEFYCMYIDELNNCDMREEREPGTAIRDADGLHRDADGLREHIDNLSERSERKLSICLYFFPCLFRSLSLFLIRLSAKPTKWPIKPKRNEAPLELSIGPCPMDCHGECSHCAFM